MSESLQNKIEKVKKHFLTASSAEKRYETLIEWGKKTASFPSELKIPENLVWGCQSSLYLHSSLTDGVLHFQAASDALISAGLAALLIAVYNGETPEIILKTPPDFLNEIGLYASLSPNRSNGLNQIYLRMKQEAVKWLMAQIP